MNFARIHSKTYRKGCLMSPRTWLVYSRQKATPTDVAVGLFKFLKGSRHNKSTNTGASVKSGFLYLFFLFAFNRFSKKYSVADYQLARLSDLGHVRKWSDHVIAAEFAGRYKKKKNLVRMCFRVKFVANQAGFVLFVNKHSAAVSYLNKKMSFSSRSSCAALRRDRKKNNKQ